jgi:hypothetical protein
VGGGRRSHRAAARSVDAHWWSDGAVARGRARHHGCAGYGRRRHPRPSPSTGRAERDRRLAPTRRVHAGRSRPGRLRSPLRARRVGGRRAFPDGIKPPPRLGGGRKTVGVPGGSQALSRSEAVTVTVNGRAFELRRPTLLGAILIKARSLMVHSDPETQREDLLRLLALVDDPREVAAQLRRTERAWLRATQRRLNFAGSSTLDGETMRRAALAYRLLLRNPDRRRQARGVTGVDSMDRWS